MAAILTKNGSIANETHCGSCGRSDPSGMRYDRGVVARNAIVVGGGIAGLTAAIYLARGGRKVTLFERKSQLGGRAVTELRHGFRFNLGPHAVYRAGVGSLIYRDVGIPIRGGMPRRAGVALTDGSTRRLPITPFSILFTSMLSFPGKLEALSLLLRLRRMKTAELAAVTIGDWLHEHIRDNELRRVLRALCRVVTYSEAEEQSAAVALEQLRISTYGVVYVDDGWQKIVDALHSHAVSAGVNFVTSANVIGVDHDGKVEAIRIGGLDDRGVDTTKGTRLAAEDVVLAVPPRVAAALVGDASLAEPWLSLRPVTVASLAVALSKLPKRKPVFAVGIDKPLYASVHSAYAQLTPRGGALVHLTKYLDPPAETTYDDDYEGEEIRMSDRARSDESELESLLDRLQPGWRDVLVHRRFLPGMTVTHALVTPASPRPPHRTNVRGLYVAGDWVGAEGLMADAALASARAAASSILES